MLADALEERIAKFASVLFIGGVPLGEACFMAEQVLNPKLPGYAHRPGAGMHQPVDWDEGLYNDMYDGWDNA